MAEYRGGFVWYCTDKSEYFSAEYFNPRGRGSGLDIGRLFNQRQSLAYEFLFAAAYIRLWHHQLFFCLCRIAEHTAPICCILPR